ncbi:MAG: hypothetical protein ACP5OG_06070 [Candidatus Nanoarchaeia archaeon]
MGDRSKNIGITAMFFSVFLWIVIIVGESFPVIGKEVSSNFNLGFPLSSLIAVALSFFGFISLIISKKRQINFGYRSTSFIAVLGWFLALILVLFGVLVLVLIAATRGLIDIGNIF